MAAWLLVIVAASACASPAGPRTAAPTRVSAPQTIELRIGESVPAEGTGVTLTFVRVAEDSRCPVGVSCVWEGDAAVELRATSGAGAAATLRLHTNDGFAREGQAHGLTVRLEGLTPHPAGDRGVSPADYVATLLVVATR